MSPGKRNSLDAPRDCLGISNAHRTLHGALLDVELLAEVYLTVTRGQNTLMIDMLELGEGASAEAVTADLSALQLSVLLVTEAEAEAHVGVLKEIDEASGGKTV